MTIIQIGSYSLNTYRIEGGIEASILGLVNAYKNNNQVIVFDLPRHDICNDFIDDFDNVSIYRFASLSSNNFLALKRTKEYIKKIKLLKPDICHIHGTGYIQLIVFLMLKIFGIPVIVTVHGLQHVEKKNEWKNNKTIKSLIKYVFLSLSEFSIIAFSKLIIVDTLYVKNEINSYYRQKKIFKKPEIKVIPQGINSNYFSLTKTRIINNNILCVGSINKRKGQIELIKSINLVKKQIPDIKANIVGFVSDKSYYEQAKKLIRELNLDDNISIHTNVTNDELINYYKNTCVFVLHSMEESQGIVLCEALACGLPVISTNSGGIPYVIINEKNGLLSPFGDIEKFADNIVKVLLDISLYNNLSVENKITSQKYNWEEISIEVFNCYLKVIST